MGSFNYEPGIFITDWQVRVTIEATIRPMTIPMFGIDNNCSVVTKGSKEPDKTGVLLVYHIQTTVQLSRDRAITLYELSFKFWYFYFGLNSRMT